jgi:SAM-dependent methyltransferase
MAQLLACPLDHSELRFTENRLECERRHSFAIEGGVPVFDAQPRRELHPRNMGPVETDPRSPVDPFVNDWIVNTNGNLYWHLRGRLPRYPIPEWPFEPGKGRLFVDLGCGWGRWCFSAGRAGFTAVGFDVHLDGVQAAHRVSAQLAPEAAFICSEIDALPFRSGEVDVVFSYSVLQHVERSKVALILREAWRVLKPGGQILIQLPNKFGPVSLVQQIKRGFREARPGSFEMRYWSPSQIRQLARGSGFADMRLRADGFLSQNPQISDLDLLSLPGKLIVLLSYIGCKTSATVAPLIGIADSLWLQAQKHL